MKRKLCLALSAVMLAGSLSGCSGGTSGLPGDTSKASEAPAGKEAEGTKGESAAGEAGEKPYAGTTIRVLSMTGRYQMQLKRIWMILRRKPASR